jgi:hypothetical protein
MQESASHALAEWSSFYVITGSSGAALTGLVFVVITLLAGKGARNSDEATATFSTPTVVHFCMALFISTVLSAPWRSLVHVGVVVALTGVFGIVHMVRVMLRQNRLTTYHPDLEDRIWYGILPFIAYVATVAGGILLRVATTDALFALAAATLLLIFIGIHNAWDMVTYIATNFDDEPASASPADATPPPPAEAVEGNAVAHPSTSSG